MKDPCPWSWNSCSFQASYLIQTGSWFMMYWTCLPRSHFGCCLFPVMEIIMGLGICLGIMGPGIWWLTTSALSSQTTGLMDCHNSFSEVEELYCNWAKSTISLFLWGGGESFDKQWAKASWSCCCEVIDSLKERDFGSCLAQGPSNSELALDLGSIPLTTICCLDASTIYT